MEKVIQDLLVIFDKYSELSDFKKCRKVISEKQKELGAYGYCI